MSLEELIHNCKKKDIKAQSEIYQMFAGKLFAVCLKYSKNYQEAEDNLQDGFITIFKKIDQFKNKGSFEGWLKRIIINTALQKFRKKSALNIVTDKVPEFEDDTEVEDQEIPLDFLLELIQKLPERYRLVFNLYVLDGYSHKEISELLEISEGTSKSNLSRARMILKNALKKNEIIYSRLVSG